MPHAFSKWPHVELPPSPPCDCHGWFQPVIPPGASSWPWALPHLYAVNVACDSGPVITRASAKRDGTVKLTSRTVSDRSRFEVVGFWRGEFGLVHWEQTRTRRQADYQAQATFDSIPVRYLMHSGQVVRENSKVQITGDWPSEWTIASLQYLGVFCAYIYDRAREGGAQDAADLFRQSITPAAPQTEQVLVYIAALKKAQTTLSQWLNSKTNQQLAEVTELAQKWLT